MHATLPAGSHAHALPSSASGLEPAYRQVVSISASLIHPPEALQHHDAPLASCPAKHSNPKRCISGASSLSPLACRVPHIVHPARQTCMPGVGSAPLTTQRCSGGGGPAAERAQRCSAASQQSGGCPGPGCHQLHRSCCSTGFRSRGARYLYMTDRVPGTLWNEAGMSRSFVNIVHSTRQRHQKAWL